MNEAPLQQYADGPIGQVVPTFAEIQEWRPGSSHLWRSFPKGKRHNVKFLKKSVQSNAQVRSLALKSLEFNSFPLRAFHLWPLDNNRVLHGDVWRRGTTT